MSKENKNTSGKRPFDFDQATRQSAFFRQWNRCAHCGRDLLNTEDHAHHVVPNQVGRPGSEADAWIRGTDNCVILCDTCHHRVHENGRYRFGAVASPASYPFTHGRQKKDHRDRVARMNKRFWG